MPVSLLDPGNSTASPRRRRPTQLVALAAALAAVVSCSPSSPTGSNDTPAPPTTARAQHDISGTVDVAGGRKIHVECRGQGSPTVVLISGKGNGADDWLQIVGPADPAHDAPGDDVGAGLVEQGPSDDAVFPSVARFSRVCAYDRPDTRVDGTDLSTPRPQPHTVDLDVDDLHALLTAIGETGPFVLVPHSYGGWIAELFARTYPHDVAGLVMVDAATPLIEDVVNPEKLANWDATNRATSAQVREGVEIIDADRRIKAAPPMPKVPAVVLTADKPYRVDLLPPELAEGDKLLSFTDWLAAQDLLASALGAEHITSTNSGHHIYLYSPALVVAAIRDVVDGVR